MKDFSGKFKCIVDREDVLDVGTVIEDDEVVFSAFDSDVDRTTVIVLRSNDAVEMAWGILDALGVSERPTRVGDFVKVVRGPSQGCWGRVTKVDRNDTYTDLYIESPGVKGGHVSESNCERVTREEFIDHINDRIREITA